MLRSELDSEIGNLLGDPGHDRWSLSVIHDRENIAQNVVASLTNCIIEEESITVTSASAYSLTGKFFDVVRVMLLTDSVSNTLKLLEARSVEDLDFYNPNWLNEDAGEPQYWNFSTTNQKVGLYPKPSSTYQLTNGLTVYKSVPPDDLTSDSDEPFDAIENLQPYAYSIVHWVVAQCWMDDGTPEALGKSKFHKSGSLENPGEFEKYIKLINAKFNSPTGIPARIMWSPAGGRLNRI